jgi:predicted RNA-binding protein with PUA domain
MEKKKKAPSGRGKQTTYKCKQCDLPLCRVGCFSGIPQAVKCGGAKLGE